MYGGTERMPLEICFPIIDLYTLTQKGSYNIYYSIIEKHICQSVLSVPPYTCNYKGKQVMEFCSHLLNSLEECIIIKIIFESVEAEVYNLVMELIIFVDMAFI